MQQPRVRVVLSPLDQVSADIVVLPGRRARDDGRVVTVRAPRWRFPDGPDRALAEAYRAAVAAANAHAAHTLAVPAVLARGPWPLDAAITVALCVLESTPTTVRQVWVAASTPAMLERWAEALAARTHSSGRGA